MHNKPEKRRLYVAVFILCFCLPSLALAAATPHSGLDLTQTWVGYSALALFVLAYMLVVMEEFFHLRKSKPVIVAAGIIWVLVGIAYVNSGDPLHAGEALRHNILEFAELMLFLLAAMTYINTMEERRVFDALRAWLLRRGFSLYRVFWITGLLAFIISPVADNLTTALLMAAVVIAIAPDNQKFITIASINIVVAANAGGAFSPFGDITTLMVWQDGIVVFTDFFKLFLPSLVNWLAPAFILSFAASRKRPEAIDERVEIKHGGFVVIGLFLFTISMTVSVHSFLHLPPVLGMMTGLGILKFYGYYLKRQSHNPQRNTLPADEKTGYMPDLEVDSEEESFDIYHILARAEWDTLMFFYGVVLCVGGLSTIGYLASVSGFLYHDLGATNANIMIGLISAIVDNIPVIFAVLSMEPNMPLGQWLLVTLTAGVGGSLLSIGSAAGVALMGQTRGMYTFFGHLKWSWAIALGYAASIWLHLYLNADLM